MKTMDKIVDRLEEYVCLVSLSVMSLAVLLQIINRSFLGRPFPWGEELARYMMVWATVIGTAAGVKAGAHVGVDALVSLIPGRARIAFTFATSIIALVFYCVVAWLALELTLEIRDTEQTSPALQMPMWLAYLAFPVGFVLCVFRQVQIVLAGIRTLRAPVPTEGTS